MTGWDVSHVGACMAGVLAMVPVTVKLGLSRREAVRGRIQAGADAAAAGEQAAIARANTAKADRALGEAERDAIALQQALRRAQDDAAVWSRAVEGELRHLQLRVLRTVEAAWREPGVVVPGLLDARRFTGGPLDAALAAVLKQVDAAVGETQARAAESGQAGVARMVEGAQHALTRCQSAIYDAQQGDMPADAQPLLDTLDQVVTRARHAVQRVGVLAGLWPGMQWGDSPLGRVIDAACGRIAHPSHVTHIATSADETVVEGRAAEPLIIALTELLDNAESFSGLPVTVYAQHASTGVSVVIQDRGTGMDLRARDTAMAALGAAEPPDVTALPGSYGLGLHVVAVQARGYGFGVRVGEPSPHGGTEAVVFIPSHLTKPARPADAPPPGHGAATAREPADRGTTPSGLPRRTPGLVGAPPQQTAPADASTGTAAEAGEELDAFAAAFGGLQSAFDPQAASESAWRRGTGPDADTSLGGDHDDA